MPLFSKVVIWAALACAVMFPIWSAAASPLLAYRSPIYITGGMAGIAALAILLIQPLLAAGYLPGLRKPTMSRWHKRLGAVLVASVALHVGGLYLASPQDALDALLLVSPTPFSIYGVTAMWALVLTVLLVAARGRLCLRPSAWNVLHNGLALVVVVGTVIHALMIEGAMGANSKLILCLCVLGATAGAVLHLRIVRPLLRRA